ncbi:ROK family protein [Marinomonas sp. RSW2]|uniref:ROK family protein n=1 Tax=Marinomonas maritima TaxID=2940935 RepID=A0ABT5WHY6_9GAMM|nr:ROK family protein [Marinomonas maritima]MDE8604432.1 ROK family protein [Marinomonas maritima]
MSFTLLADIGGTNTRFVLAKEGHGILSDSYEAFPNSGASSPEVLIQRYFQNQGIESCKQVVLALAAPTYGEEIVLTNHDWRFTIKSISAVSGAQDVRFINDLEALGYGLSALKSEQLQHLAGPSISGKNGPRVVVGAGTGFNAAIVTQAANGDHHVKAMEVGHMTLTVETQDEFDLWQYLAQGRERASVERALSGLGIEQIYQWHCQKNAYKPLHINAQSISSAALNKTDPMAEKAMQTFVHIYARTVGDLALAFLPKGGIFLSGSVTRAMAPWLQGSGFFDCFLAKGRQRDLMRQFPIYILQDDQAALLGCEIAANYDRN